MIKLSTMQLVPGNMILMKNDAYQGSETEYVVVCQVADGIPA